MNTRIHVCRPRLLGQKLALVLCFLWLPWVTELRAGLTFTVDVYRAYHGQFYNFYTPLSTNTALPDLAVGVYTVNSPGWPTNGSTRTYEMTPSGFNPNPVTGSEHGYYDFDSTMDQITNGTWTILFTNTTTTNIYTFTVSAPNLDSNQIPATIISSPADGAINVPNQPAPVWQGPTSWPVTGDAYFYNYDDSIFYYDNLPAAQTDWMVPDALPNGVNGTFQIGYRTNNTTSVFLATTPTNAANQVISGWEVASILETGDSVSFAITNPPVSSLRLVAHYTFDDSGNLGQDTSGNGYDLDFNGGDGVVSDGTAMAGSGAASFNGNSFFAYTSTPTNILSAFAGDFSLSFWIQTTQDNGNQDGPGWAGVGLVSGDVPYYNNYDLIPAALDGGQIGFNTGPYDDTLNSTVNINDGSYHHIVVTRNESTGEKQIYIDGVLDNFDTDTLNPLSDPRSIAIGCKIDASQADPNNLNPSQYFDGLLDDLQIYAGVLSEGEVAALFANPGTTAAATEFAAALNTTNLVWTTGGDLPWFTQTTNTLDGEAAQSGAINDGESSYLETTAPTSGQLSFFWKVSSEQDWDFLHFYINGNEQDAISGEVDWTQQTYTVAANDVLRWEYTKDPDCCADGLDAGFLDQVSLVAGLPDTNTAPVITVNPFSQTNFPGYTVGLYAAATSNPTATWQWFKVGSGLITNATSALYIPTNSGTAGVTGSYYAVASNFVGTATTVTAAVTFVSATLPPDWSRAFKSQLANNSTDDTTNYNIACLLDATGTNIYSVGSTIGTNTFGSDVLISINGKSGSSILKQTTAGTPIWGRCMTNNGNGSSYAQSVAAAPGDGIYVAGVIFGTNWLGTNMLVDTAGGSTYLARFDANGSNNWIRVVSGTNFNFSTYHMLASDPDGNVTLSLLIWGDTSFGTTNVFADGQRGILVQYDTNGILRWLQMPSGWPDYLTYNAGCIYGSMGGSSVNYIGGVTNNSDRKQALFSIIATNGQGQWVHGLGAAQGQGSPSGFGDDSTLVAVSGTNIFVAGSVWGSSADFGTITVALPTNARGQYLARYDTNGTAQLARTFGSPYTWSWAIGADAAGNVYVGGDFDTYSVFGNNVISAPFYETIQSLGSIDVRIPGQSFMAKFDRDGNSLWARVAESQSSYLNMRDLAVDADGVWACGFFNQQSAFGNILINGGLTVVGSPIGSLVYHPGGYLAKIAAGTAAALPVTLLNPQNDGTNFQFQFLSQSGFIHAVQYRTNLLLGNWLNFSNVTGDGNLRTIPIPLSVFGSAAQGFVRVTNAVAP